MVNLHPMKGIAFILCCDAKDFDLHQTQRSAFIRCHDAQQALLCRIRFGFGYTSEVMPNSKGTRRAGPVRVHRCCSINTRIIIYSQNIATKNLCRCQKDRDKQAQPKYLILHCNVKFADFTNMQKWKSFKLWAPSSSQRTSLRRSLSGKKKAPSDSNKRRRIRSIQRINLNHVAFESAGIPVPYIGNYNRDPRHAN